MSGRWLCVLLVTACIAVLPATVGTARSQELAIDGAIGAGVFAPASTELYGGKSSLFYPEVRLHFELSFLRIGGRVGMIKSTQNEWTEIMCCPEVWDYGPYERSFVPAFGELLIAPVDVALPSGTIKPYAGFALGSFIATGDKPSAKAILTRLLARNPKYAGKSEVEQMLSGL